MGSQQVIIKRPHGSISYYYSIFTDWTLLYRHVLWCIEFMYKLILDHNGQHINVCSHT